MNLLELREGIAAKLDTELTGVFVATHEGEFRIDDVRRYAQRTPAVIVSLGGFDGNQNQIVSKSGALVSCMLVIFTENRPANLKDKGSLSLVTQVYRLLTNKQFWAMDDLSAPRNIKGKNYYSTGLDKLGVSLWSIGFDTEVDLYDDSESFDDLNLIYAEYDLGPDPDGTIESTDQITV